MAGDNLFTALRKYRPTADRDPIEDFVTEAFAWLLRRHTDLAGTFLHDLSERLPRAPWGGRPGPIWKTQVVFDDGRLDMVAEFDDAAVVFEHKVWSLLGENQLGRYRTASARLWPGGSALVLITASTTQHESGADVSLTWADVYRITEGWSATQGQPPELVADFLGLLAEQGLAPPPPVSHEAIISYLPAQAFVPSMVAVVKGAMLADWSFVYDKLAWPGAERTPYLRGRQPDFEVDGRLGVDFLHGWRPGVFLGVILDGSDHEVTPSSPRGPDFCLVLTLSPEEGTPLRKAYMGSTEFKLLQERLGREAQGWDFADTRDHDWHVLHLRRPLLDVMRGTLNLEDQVKRFVDHGRDAVRVLLAGGELEELHARLAQSMAVAL